MINLFMAMFCLVCTAIHVIHGNVLWVFIMGFFTIANVLLYNASRKD